MWLKRKVLAAAVLSFSRRGRGGQGFQHVRNLLQSPGVQGVVHPATLPTVGDQVRVLQHLQVEGEARLSGLESIGEIADAALTEAEPLEDGESGTIRQGVEQPGGPIDVGASAGSHGFKCIKIS